MTYHFTLFVAGQGSRSTRAIEKLRELAARALAEDFELVVVDVVEDPVAAETQKILATPTVIKGEPGPERRVTGDLSDLEAVGLALGLPR